LHQGEGAAGIEVTPFFGSYPKSVIGFQGS
jgi:hypothetical protein